MMSALKCLTWTTRLDKIMEEVQLGDLVKFHRGLFIHHAVYVGKGRAVHHHLGPADGEVIEATMEYLAKGDLMKVFKVPDTPYSPKEIVRRARSQIGPLPYSLHNGNCEHFTTWVYHGVHESSQLSGLCRYELRLLQIVRHGSSKRSRGDSAAAAAAVTGAASGSSVRDRQEVPDTSRPDEDDHSVEEDDDAFVFVPPRPIKYRHTKNPARIACNHALSCLKVLAIQSVLGLAAVPLYRCGMQADNLRRLGRRLTIRRHAATEGGRTTER